MTRLLTDEDMAEIAYPTTADHVAFRAWLRKAHGTTALPVRLDDALYAKAWDMGHAHGYGEVAIFYADLAEMVLMAYVMGARS